MFEKSEAFASFSVDDLSKAKEFYGGVLGLGVKEEDMGVLSIEIAGGNPIIVYPKPNHTPATFTILNFPVSDIEQAVNELTARGVRFEHYDSPDIKTDAKGIATDEHGPKIAWFTDPAGNVLSVIEQG